MYKTTKIKLLILFFSSSIFFLNNVLITYASTGFLGGPMWIDPESPQDGQYINLSALFHNAEPNQLTGVVSFYDGNILLGNKSITINPGSVSTATVSFSIGAGDHSFSATVGTMTENLGNGQTEPFVLSPQTVELPSIHVDSKAGNSLNATVVSNTSSFNQLSPNNPLAPVVSQVNQLEGSVISGINSSVGNPISNAISGLENWRTTNSDLINQQTKASSEVIQKLKTLPSIQNTQKKTLSPNFFDGPFAYVKYFFLTLLSYLYSHSIVFYGTAILLIFIIMRFVFRKLAGLKKTSSRVSNSNKRTRY